MFFPAISWITTVAIVSYLHDCAQTDSDSQ
jgi:hypothetical protein